MNTVTMAKEFESLKKAVEAGSRVVSVNGLTAGGAKAFVLARLHAETGKAFAVVTDTNKDLGSFENDLDFFLSQSSQPTPPRLLSLPSFETDVYSGVSPHAETQERRALTFWELANQRAGVLLMSARSLITRTLPPASFRSLGVTIARDEDISLDHLIELLASSGYVREDPISNVGQFSLRGGIVDVWPPTSPSPVRMEFFGDTVDSIREFDAETQLSTGQLQGFPLPPMREFAASSDDFRNWGKSAEKRFTDTRFARALRDRTDFASQGESFAGWEFLLPLSKPLTGSVFDYIGECVLVVDEPVAIELELSSFYGAVRSKYAAIEEANEIGLPPSELFLEPDELRNALSRYSRLEFRSLGKTASLADEEFQVDGSSDTAGSVPLFLFSAAERSQEIEIQSRSIRKFGGDVQAFSSDLMSRAKRNDLSGQDLIVMNTSGMVERIEELMRDYGVAFDPRSVLIGDLSGGFELPAFGLTIFTETDIFGESVRPQIPTGRGSNTLSKKSRLGAFISDFRDLKQGDYVVHVDHGIGRFDGLQTISSQGAEREFMLLVYSDEAKLFVPVERMDLVSRYSSGEATSPTLDRLGGIGWQKTKAKAKRAMRDMADELLRLYAERKLVRGHAFPPDAPWQHEFEDAFPFELTVDQASAIEDVKTDMETAMPMDRLIIGDVGYGKTEVAMRAAFKAVMDGKQVAILTPTTVLAYQHFETFSKRFAAFPVKVDLLSRFRSTKEQKSVVELASKGEVDVLIGTHRVLSKDVELPKLGLVVVDEEQRFGVGHKETLKQLKKKVDVLTLSATPIPRTLNMSLLGMRDMSVIETPPRDRLAINTQVVQFSESVIRSAIDLELSRNGQVFFIHNRVETIESVAALVQKIVPNARVAIGHGQMNEKEMEQAMLDFIDYKYDILVATTIIENGIDIPRANTIIINRADNYGLSQLYQLRGRVGRSNRRAYAYLLIPSEIELTPIARRRLSAIREFSDLGAGFRLAALDLELRGAGNILGGQQSGHLDALGFDLYTKMLERTIAELQGDEVADETSVAINLGVDVSIPKDYIQDASQRLRTYKRVSSADGDEAFAQINREIEDRYGRLPRSVVHLFEYGRLRKSAEAMKILSIDRTPGGIAIKLSENAAVSPEHLMAFLAENPSASFSPNGILRFDVAENVISASMTVLDRIRP